MGSEAKVTVSLVSNAVATGLTKVKSQFKQFRQELNSDFARFAAFGSIAAGLEQIISKATDVQNTAKRFGAPAQELQRVANAGRENGATLEDVGRAWNKLEVNRQKALDGNDAARKGFEDLGISMKEVKDLTIDQLFYRIADATASAEDRGKAYAAVYSIMGRNAGVLFTTLEQGSKSIKANGDAMGVMNDKTLESLHRVHVAFEVLKNQIMIYGGSVLIFFKNVIETIVTLVSSGLVYVEGMMSGIGKALGLALKGQFGDAGNALKAAFKENTLFSPQVRGDIAGQLKDIWNPKTEHRSEKRPIDEEVGLSNSEESKAEKLAKLKEKLADLTRKASNEELDTQEKITALMEQRKKVLAEAAGTQDEEKKLELMIQAAEIQKEINAAQTEKDREDDAEFKARERQAKADLKAEGKAPRIAADSLARIGGGGNIASVQGSDRQLKEAQEHTKLLRKIEENIRSGRPLIME